MKEKMEFKNIFLHFLEHDTQEMFDIIPSKLNRSYTSIVQRVLGASILLCKEYCVMTPSFYFESKLTQDVISHSIPYINNRFIRFAIREIDLDNYINVKQRELEKCKDMENYHGYFRIPEKKTNIMNAIAHQIIPREARIGKIWNELWIAGIDAIFSTCGESIITDITDDNKFNLDFLRNNHDKIFDDGVYLWTYLRERGFAKLPKNKGDSVFENKMRIPFQKYYFSPYLKEYEASLLWDLPFDNNKDFLLKKQFNSACNYHWFYTFLGCLSLKELLDKDPEILCEIKNFDAFNNLKIHYLEIVNSPNFSASNATSMIRDGVTYKIRNKDNDISEMRDRVHQKMENKKFILPFGIKRDNINKIDINIIRATRGSTINNSQIKTNYEN